MLNGITHLNKGFDISNLTKEQIDNVQDVYVCPSFECNLHCPHCTLRTIKTQSNIDKIFNDIDVFNTSKSKLLCYNIFGGEPLLNDENILKLLHDKLNKKYIISTNLLEYKNTNIINELLKDARWVDTSWNPKRFHNTEEYNLWLKNIQILKDMGIKINFMITLTDDFLDNYTPRQFLDMMRKWDIYSLDLEFFIGDDTQDMNRVDNFLLELYTIWDIPTIYNNVVNMRNSIINNCRYKDCSNNYTILPTGMVNYCCPYYEETVMNPNCYSCKYFEYCGGGCPLQFKCTLPKKLYEQLCKEI